MKTDYFDWAATSPMSEEAIEDYCQTAREFYANPSASHTAGAAAGKKLSECRKKASELLGCEPEDLYFTGGGTESDSIILNSALLSVNPGHIIISKAEHSAILQYEKTLQQKGWTISYLPCPKGYANPEDLKKLLTPQTRYVFIMIVNNILGTIEDLKGLVSVCRDYEKATGRKIHFHADAVQACGKIPFDFKALGIDSAAIAAHKFCGPRGVGILINRNRTIKALSPGGGQEKGLRPGTENLAGISSMVCALGHAVRNMEENSEKVMELRSCAEKILAGNGFTILSPSTGSGLPFSPYILNASTDSIPSEVFVRVVSDSGFCISAGSACNNNSKKKVEGLGSLGFSSQLADTSFRISFGFPSTVESTRRLCETLCSIKDKMKLR